MIAADGLFSPCHLPSYPLSYFTAPILFCKACESMRTDFPSSSLHVLLTQFAYLLIEKVFIAEITARAFIVADSNKRRTLSRADIAKALGKSDQFDFLIDIVPRDEPFVPGVSGPGKSAAKKTIPGSTNIKRDLVGGTGFIRTVLSLIDMRSASIQGGRRCTG